MLAVCVMAVLNINCKEWNVILQSCLKRHHAINYIFIVAYVVKNSTIFWGIINNYLNQSCQHVIFFLSYNYISFWKGHFKKIK